jgi:hypothetical protein
MALAVTLPVRDVAIPDCATVIEVGLFHTVAQIVRIARSMIAVAVQLGAGHFRPPPSAGVIV